MCSICDISNNADEPLHLFTEDEIEQVITLVYAGVITTHNLDVNTYLKIARKLLEGVYTGYDEEMTKAMFMTQDFEMLKSLRENVYVFSAAKTYQQTREMSAAITEGNNIVPFSQFKVTAKEIFLQYNENYLRTEYNSAIAQANTARQWQEIEKTKEYLPMLTYKTAGDGRVRPTHEALNNISRPVDDKFWDKYMPPNGWNCRCTVLQSSDAIETSLTGFKAPSDVPLIFRFNAGKEKIIFSPKHPYFKVAKGDKEFAKENFGLPT